MSNKNKKHGAWIDDLFTAVGRYVSLETGSGTVREGKLTGLRCKQLQMNGQTVDLVEELELNGDPTDLVPFGELANITIR